MDEDERDIFGTPEHFIRWLLKDSLLTDEQIQELVDACSTEEDI